MKKIIIIGIILTATIIIGYNIPESSEVKVMERIDSPEEMNLTTDVKCENKKNMLLEKCNDFMDTWYSFHSDRLSLSRQDIDEMTIIVSLDSNSTASPGVTIYDILYYIDYGNGIRVITHDAFPLSISSNIKEYPSLLISRDDTHLSNSDLDKIGKMQAWYSNLTLFPKQLSYKNKSEIENDIKDNYKNKGVPSINYQLLFERAEPIARLSGADTKGDNCYDGRLNLLTKQSEFHLFGPCMIE